MKQEINNKEFSNSISNLSPIIKISHFNDDKHIKTEVFPISHFLDQSSLEIKKLRYC
ncbi:MAG: hypothetical protein VX976_01480 [Pseudomonadota bacterium]|nr:hypothetical protein [Pseudomonadota bacterium]